MKDFSEIRPVENEVLEEALQDPPMIVVLRRTAIRTFPGNERVALYHNDKLGIEVSVPYTHGHIGGKKITAQMKEAVNHEARAAAKLGEYVYALRHGRNQVMQAIHQDLAHRHGTIAADHFHNAATLHNEGHFDKADKNWQHFLRHMKEDAQPTLQEGAIHKLHHIAKTGKDGDVLFKNGNQARVSAKQALSIIKLHKALTPENKTKLENDVNNSPEDMRKHVDFSNENLK